MGHSLLRIGADIKINRYKNLYKSLHGKRKRGRQRQIETKMVIMCRRETTGHENVNIDHFEILSNDKKDNKFKRKLPEALQIKHERPTLNIQEQSVPLKLLN